MTRFSNLFENFDCEETVKLGELTPGTHTIIISDELGCEEVQSFLVEEDGFPENYYFTPNGDGHNDWLIIDILENERFINKNNEVIIKNRVGMPLITIQNYDNQRNNWDGRAKGKDIPTGVYYMTLFLENEKIFSASVNLARN